MAAALSNDLILEIISNLPLKFLVQCKCLNKNFNFFISDPVFQSQHAFRSSTTFDCLLHHSLVYPGSSISKVHLHPHDTINTKVPEILLRRLPRSPDLPTILSSSGGLLLLEFSSFSFPPLCVFNPMTGAYRFVPSPEEATYISLVSKLTNPSSYKLVAVCMQIVENKMCHVFKIFDSDASNWDISPATFSSNKIKLIDEVYQTAYLHDSVYWLKGDGEILVFNMKTEQAKIINQPEDLQNKYPSTGTWFGVIQDQLAMTTNNAIHNKISIYLYDPTHGKWRIDKLLNDTYYFYPDCVTGKGYPVFYDGKRLVLLLVTTPKGLRKELYMFDVAANSVRKIKNMPSWSDANQMYRHFFGTLAKIPHCSYVRERFQHGLEEEEEEDSRILEILFRMQKYVSSDTLAAN